MRRCLLAVATATALTAADGGELLVAVDQFHSVLIIPAVHAPAPGPATGWATLHYGERRWMTAPDWGFWHAATLGVTGGRGLIQSDRFADLSQLPETVQMDPATVRIWRFRVSEEAWTALSERLRTHWRDRADSAFATLDQVTTYLPSQREWTLSENCHDFTVDLLRSAGVPVPHGRVIIGARQLRLDLDRIAQ